MSRFDDVLDLLPEADVKVGRSTGERYSKYHNAITRSADEEPSIAVWAKEKISSSKDGHIRMLLSKLAAECGMPLKEKEIRGRRDRDKRGSAALIWGFKYAFYQEGIWVQQGTTKKGAKKVLDMRMRRMPKGNVGEKGYDPGDELPNSLVFEELEDEIEEEAQTQEEQTIQGEQVPGSEVEQAAAEGGAQS